MRKHRFSGCHVDALSHMDGCLYEDKDYRFEFGLIENKLYVYSTMVYELCMRLQEKMNKLPLNIEMTFVVYCLMMLFAVIFKTILCIASVVKN